MTEVLAALGEAIDLPALILIFCLLVGYGLMRKHFDWRKAGEDDAGKASYLRLAVPVSLVVSSWLLIYVTMKVIGTSVTWVQALEALFPFYLTYMAIWPGSKVAEKGLDVLLARYAPKQP